MERRSTERGGATLSTVAVYLPMDWRQALAQKASLPERTTGSALFADISGFTPLVEALTQSLGMRRGAEELSRRLNQVYDALIGEIDRYGGSVVSFAGDAITCWFDAAVPDPTAPQSALRAAVCALAIQKAMGAVANITISDQHTVTLAVKVAIASGAARRFVIGNPDIQLVAALAGQTLARMAAAEHFTNRGEIVMDEPTVQELGNLVRIGDWRQDMDTGWRFALLESLLIQVAPSPWAPQVLRAAEEASLEASLRAWILPAVYERLQAGLGEFITELRPAITLFLRFGGIDFEDDPQAGARLNDYFCWVQRVLAFYGGSLLQLTIGDKGSYLYAAFGAPVAHEDDPRRAVTAALELQSPPANLAFVGAVQIGLSQGMMRTGAYGGTNRRTYGVLGDQVNLSARLMQFAAPGEVIVNQALQKIVVDEFAWESLQEIQVKGKSAPIPVARLAGRRQFQAEGARILRTFASPMVGREAEMVQLRAALARAKAGQGQIVRLQGETGVGKSRLAAEYVREIIAGGGAAPGGVRVCAGVCQSTTQHMPYAPWRSIFRALLGLQDESMLVSAEATELPSETQRFSDQAMQVEQALRAINPDWCVRLPLLGDLLGVSIPDNEITLKFDPHLRQEALFTLAVSLVEAYSRQQTLLLILEDVHWIDEASSALIMALGRVIGQMPAMLVVVHRPAAYRGQPLLPGLEVLAGYQVIELHGLPPERIVDLMSRRLSGRPAPLAVSLVQLQAQGNPFFAEQLVDALREAGKLVQLPGDASAAWTLSAELVAVLQEANCLTKDLLSGEWIFRPDAQLSGISLDVPSSVHGAVLARLDKLPEAHKLTLKVASVIGRIFELALLVRAHPAYPGREAFEDQIQTFERRDFAEMESPPPQTAYIFKHNVTQEVMYGTLLEAQQRSLHGAVGAALERMRPDAVEHLVYHFTRASVREKAILYLDKAARKAQREYANETALNYFSQALALEERWEWRKGQIEVLHILGWRDEEREALLALEAMPNAPVYEVTHLCGQYYESIGDYIQAQAAIQRALESARNQFDQVNEANCLAQLGLIARRLGDYERAANTYQKALALFFEGEAGSEEEALALVRINNGLGIVLRQQGHFNEANIYYQRALALCQRIGNRQGEAETLNGLGAAAYYQRYFPEAMQYYQQALEIRRKIGDRSGEGASLVNLAQATRDSGDYGKAEEYFRAALAILQAIGNRWDESNAWNDLGVLYQELGDFAQAQRCLERGLAICRELGDEAGQVYLLINLALVLLAGGDLTLAEKLLLEALELARKTGDRYIESALLSQLGICALKAEQTQQAIEWANQALLLRLELDMRLWTTDNLATLALAHWKSGYTAQALDYARQALALLEECGGRGPECPQQDYFICYQVFQAAGESETAQLALERACQLVIERADKITDAALRQSFLEKVPVNRQIVQARASFPRST